MSLRVTWMGLMVAMWEFKARRLTLFHISSIMFKEKVKSALEQLLGEGRIEPTDSAWAAPEILL